MSTTRSKILSEITAFKQKGDHTTWNGDLGRAREIFQESFKLHDEEGIDISFEEDFVWFHDELQLAEMAAERGEEPGLIDTAEAERQFALCGIGPTDPVIICCYGDTNAFTPAQVGGCHDWEAITVAARAGNRDWDRVHKLLKNPKTPNLGFISSPGGSAYKSRPEIKTVTMLVYEIDSIPKEQQHGLWTKAGLPDPTFCLDTGGKSIHVWFRLTSPVSIAEGKQGRRRISAAIEAVLPQGKKTDHTMHNVAQPARLAGGIHPKHGKRSTIVFESDNAYDFDALMALCPALPERSVGQSDGDVFNDGPDPDQGEEFPSFPLEKVPPLHLALSTKTWSLICKGQQGGEATGRPVTAFRLLKTLRASEAMFESIGQEFEGDWRELFGNFVVNSGLYDGDVDCAIDKHWSEDYGAGELSRTYFLRKLRNWARTNCMWRDSAEMKIKGNRWAKSSKRIETPGPLVHVEVASNDDDAQENEPVAEPMPGNGGRADEWFKERWTDHKLRREYFFIDHQKTVEQKVEVAFLELCQYLEQPITNHDNRFLEYVPGAGYYKFMPMSVVKNAVAELLQFFYTFNKKASFKQSTEAKCKACVSWLNTRLDEPQMNVIDGIAFTNGTYRLDTRALVPHSPQYLLTWAIQGQFSPAATCPKQFRQFIISSFGEEWLSVIQMTLRYIVDPTFKPSKIVLILGPSGSGKGTLERLIEKIFPQDCISVITSNFQDINHPDKIRQFVRGKRLVVFPDLQGRQFGVGTIYSMTDGGLLTSRALHEAEADAGEAFNGRLVICSTQPPSMEDAGNGMTRRMMVLRTLDRKDQKPDHDLDDKLEAELGEIVSWALEAAADDVKEMLRSGDPAGLLQMSSNQAEVQMDPIRSFIDQCLERKDADVFPSDVRLFTVFKIFCHDQKHKPTAQRTFVNRLKAALPHLRIERMAVPGSQGQKKTSACFFGLGLRDGLFHDQYPGGSGADPTNIREENGWLDRNNYGEGGLDSVRKFRPPVPDASVIATHQGLLK